MEFTTDPRGIATYEQCNLAGQTILKLADWTGSDVMGPVGTTTEYSPTDSTNQSTAYTYDGDDDVSSPAVSPPTRDSGLPTALNLITQYAVDLQGRTTEIITPNGNTTYIVYNDTYATSTTTALQGIRYEVRVYTGWTGSAETGPTQITREIWPAASSGDELFTETLTTSDTPAVTSGVPNGSETVTAANIQRLTRDVTNALGQLAEEDKCFTLAGVTYSLGLVWLGLGSDSSATGSYYPTSYGYDINGNQNRVEAPTGTITRTVFNSLGWAMNQSIGTMDSGWGTGSYSGNMVQVSSNTYDSDGDILSTTVYRGGSQPNGVTNYTYDFQDRLILEIDGYGSSQPIVTATSYDNADEVTEVQQYAGYGFNASSGADNSSLLRGQTTYAYDDQGRNYQTSIFSVAPFNASSPGTVGASLSTQMYYDADGNTIAMESPDGLWTKSSYDGADRLIEQDQTNGAGGSSYSDAGSIAADVVFSQMLYKYDGDSNVIETIEKVGRARISGRTVKPYTDDGCRAGCPAFSGDSHGSAFDNGRVGICVADAVGMPADHGASGQGGERCSDGQCDKWFGDASAGLDGPTQTQGV